MSRQRTRVDDQSQISDQERSIIRERLARLEDEKKTAKTWCEVKLGLVKNRSGAVFLMAVPQSQSDRT